MAQQITGKARPVYTRESMVNDIRRELKSQGIELTKEEIAAVIHAEEDLIYQCIALEKSFTYVWGKIYGEPVAPVRLSGYYAEMEGAKKNGGYAPYKRGNPKIRWSRAAKLCEKHPAKEYFEMPEHKYTTEARKFRQLNNMEEIPEYATLSEEKIQELCQKADEIEFNTLSKDQQARKLKDNKYHERCKALIHKGWEDTGYRPMGAISDDIPKEMQRDSIDWYIEEHLDPNASLPEKLEIYRNAIDIKAEREIEGHEDIFYKEKELIRLIKEQGLEEIPHKEFRTHYSNMLSVKYNGEEDPWDLIRQEIVNQKARFERQKTARENFEVGFSDIMDEWWEEQKDVLRNDLLEKELDKNTDIAGLSPE